jgi:hypothetical protein
MAVAVGGDSGRGLDAATLTTGGERAAMADAIVLSFEERFRQQQPEVDRTHPSFNLTSRVAENLIRIYCESGQPDAGLKCRRVLRALWQVHGAVKTRTDGDVPTCQYVPTYDSYLFTLKAMMHTTRHDTAPWTDEAENALETPQKTRPYPSTGRSDPGASSSAMAVAEQMLAILDEMERHSTSIFQNLATSDDPNVSDKDGSKSPMEEAKALAALSPTTECVNLVLYVTCCLPVVDRLLALLSFSTIFFKPSSS